MARLNAGDTVQVTVSAPSRYHPLARGVLRRHRSVIDSDGALSGFGARGTVLWTIETSEGSTFEVPETLLTKVEEE
jgi:hypothetical protein